MLITCILLVRWNKFAEGVPLPLSQERKTFSGIFIAFSQFPQNFMHVQKKDQLDSLNISEVIESEKYVYLNDRKLLFQNTLQKSTCWQVLNTAATTVAALLSELSIDPRHFELGNISVSGIWNVRILWQHVECRSHVFSSLDETNLRNVFHCYSLKNGKSFLDFLVCFRNLQKICACSKKRSAW